MFDILVCSLPLQQTSLWPSWYGVQDDLSVEEPSTALPPAASFSHLDMPPPYEAVSGGRTEPRVCFPVSVSSSQSEADDEICCLVSLSEDDLKPPPYSECARSDAADAPRPSHYTPLISEGGDSSTATDAPPPYTQSPPAHACHHEGAASHSESQVESRPV